MTSLDDLWVLEWSETQKCYHKDKLCNSVVKNINSFHCRRPNDYVPIYVGSTKKSQRRRKGFMPTQGIDTCMKNATDWLNEYGMCEHFGTISKYAPDAMSSLGRKMGKIDELWVKARNGKHA